MTQQYTSRRLTALAGAAAALTLVLAGCGGSAEPGAATPDGAPARNAAPPAADLDPAQFCAEVVRMATATMQKDAANPNTDPAKLFAEHADEWAKVAQLAPAEIKPDAQRIADAMQKAATGGGDPAATMAQLREPMAHYVQYGAQHCPEPTG